MSAAQPGARSDVGLYQRFRVDRHGVAMHRPNEPGYNRPGVYLVDDWR